MPIWVWVLIVFIVLVCLYFPATEKEREAVRKYQRDRVDDLMGIRRDSNGKVIKTKYRPPF